LNRIDIKIASIHQTNFPVSAGPLIHSVQVPWSQLPALQLFSLSTEAVDDGTLTEWIRGGRELLTANSSLHQTLLAVTV